MSLETKGLRMGGLSPLVVTENLRAVAVSLQCDYGPRVEAVCWHCNLKFQGWGCLFALCLKVSGLCPCCVTKGEEAGWLSLWVLT